MNKTIHFLFGMAGTAGTMEVIEVFPSAPDEINTLIIIVVKSVISILGGLLSTKIMGLLGQKSKRVFTPFKKSIEVESIKNNSSWEK